MTLQALLIPVEGPFQDVELDGSLQQLQQIVGGNIEAVPLPEPFDPDGQATAYINEDGKFSDLAPNMRATDFLVPGVGLFPGDYVAGPYLLCGFDPRTGEHAELPARVVRRARKIEREAGP